jgi:hypothetical protein
MDRSRSPARAPDRRGGSVLGTDPPTSWLRLRHRAAARPAQPKNTHRPGSDAMTSSLGRRSIAAPMTAAGATPAAAINRGAPPKYRPAPRPTEPTARDRLVALGIARTVLVVQPSPTRVAATTEADRRRSRGPVARAIRAAARSCAASVLEPCSTVAPLACRRAASALGGLVIFVLQKARADPC